MSRHTFGSDNHAPVHPDVLAAIAEANRATPSPTERTPSPRPRAVVRRHLGESAEVAFVFNGTGANVVALGVALLPWQPSSAPSSAHIASTSAAHPSALAGVKLADDRRRRTAS